MKPLSLRRFNALAAYVRYPWYFLAAKELEWYQHNDEQLIGLVSADTVDNDFVSTVLGRDAKNRFRAVDVQINIASADEARVVLEQRFAELAGKPAAYFHQGDEKGGPVDFFQPVVPALKRAEGFIQLTTARQFGPAFGLIRELMHHFQDPDGNFVEQFQSGGFDARIWETYLYALFTELGYGLDRSKPAPDFHCTGPLGEFFVEATTVNPSAEPPVITDANRDAYYDHYVPIKYGSALLSKTSKKYWELQHVRGRPLLFAVQDFHQRGAMTWSNTGLVDYLYGVRQRETTASDGQTQTVTTTIDFHQWEDKKIPSGFFNQASSEHVSAILANPGGTLSKFTRMGSLSGFGEKELTILRRGLAYQGGTSPTPFMQRVDGPGYDENWCEGVSIYHNPNAKIPLGPAAFPGAAHHIFDDGQIRTAMPAFFPLGSQTILITPKADDANKSHA